LANLADTGVASVVANSVLVRDALNAFAAQELHANSGLVRSELRAIVAALKPAGRPFYRDHRASQSLVRSELEGGPDSRRDK
jgi:hypothetical protein